MDRNELPFEPCQPGVPSGASKIIYDPMARLAQTVHLSCTKTNTSHPGVPSGASKTISEPTVRLAQTVHLSSTKTNTISKRNERWFYRTHTTSEFYRVRPKWFLMLWYVWCKLWIYLPPRLTLYPNGPKRDSTWPTSARSSIECVQNDFQAYGMFGANHSPTLTQA
jgi:hypothetical protein